MSKKWWFVLAASGVLAFGVAACGDDDEDGDGRVGGEISSPNFRREPFSGAPRSCYAGVARL